MSDIHRRSRSGRTLRIGLAAVLALAIALVTLAPPLPAAPERARPALVFAAASLQEALNSAADAYARSGHPRPRLAFAGSPALARQIERGAPAALFLSADEDWVDHLERSGFIAPGTRQDFLSNRLVLIAPASRPFRADLAKPDWLARLGDGRLAMADPEAVPAGRYGKAALEALGLWQRLAPRIARAENVRAALVYVERAETNAGIVYATDAAASAKVVVAATFPGHLHPPIRYVLAGIRGQETAESRAFRAFLLSEAGKAHFRKHGFEVR
ncbi:molybdate ABC transporter substrate-binding protein [Pedomonas sp. V897]|uniref:molybdate ABC transporter substrate-binding protein n=1 Tax=Pedomonas sp. V897 TaxID=3446482 RepID=UPI003EE3CCB8